MRPEDFQKEFSVSRETLDRLEIYYSLLTKWQKTINLVSAKTLPDAWERHFADSARLASFIPESAGTLLDLGSGAGFPGLVLAILRPDLAVHLAEPDERKCQFLRTVSRETKTPVTIHNCRVESLDPELKPGVITARALAPLEKLLEYCLIWASRNPALVLLFPKGRDAQAEIDAARLSHDFTLEEAGAGEGRILRVTGLMHKK